MFGIIDIRGFMFKDIPKITFILKTTYSNIILKIIIGQEILKFY
jgi:hypothetical protein